ncbi:MAG: metallophosphoesterase [Variovorax sp.]
MMPDPNSDFETLLRRGRHLAGFAVIADSHLEPELPGSAAPRSNLRNRRLVQGLAPLAPAFALHLGDIVHPVPQAPGHDSTMTLAAALYAGLDVPLLWTPGNHDIGDKPSDMMPAATVTEEWLAGYCRVFGAPWMTHRFAGCVLLLLNSPILNSGHGVEREQRAWFEQALRDARGQRIFIATHYPPYLVSPDEPGHYDNIDLPARAWLLDLLRQHRVEAMFCGHVHNLFYNRIGPTEIYMLPSPSFVRRDYSEMFPVEAADEFGRNDTEKLGYFWVDVYEHGHVARLVRSESAGNGDEGLVGLGANSATLRPGHPKDPGEAPFGVYLRHPWSPRVDLPHNPPVDEFARRTVRNDYAVQALWDTGIRALRAPVQDLQDAQVRERIADMVALGHRFTFFAAGLPEPGLQDLLRDHALLVHRWECVVPARDVAALLDRIAPLVRETGLTLAVANLRSAAMGNTGKPAGKHFTAPGFLPEELDLVREMLAADTQRLLRAVCFRIGRHAMREADLESIREFAAHAGVTAVVTWALMPDGPNDAALDDDEACEQVERLCRLAEQFSGIDFLLDTFMDIDRGYYPRVGLLDRRCNLRPAGEMLRRRRANAI